MLEGKPTVFISYAEAAKSTVAIPFQEYVSSLGLHGVLVGEEPLPEAVSDWDPEAKVKHFLDSSQMFVALATPDETAQDGKATRQNIIDEIRMARERSHLQNRIQIFKAPSVRLPSNINPTHVPLDPDDVTQAFPLFERQARAYHLLNAQRTAPGPEEPSSPESEAILDNDTDSDAYRQSVKALARLSALLQNTETSGLGSVAARAHLATSTALATVRSADLLGVHEINGLYRERSSIKPTQAEIAHLFRTLVANAGAANAPGWYWLRNTSASELRSWIVTLAVEDSDDATKRAAIDLLERSPSHLSSSDLRSVVKAGLTADDSTASKVLSLLEKQGNRRDLKALREELNAHSDTKAVNQARLAVQAKEAPRTALQQALDNPALLDKEAEAHLLGAARKIPAVAMDRALHSTSPALRRLALRLQNSSSRLRKAEVVRLVSEDPDSSVRMLAAELAIKRRWHLTSDQLGAALKDNKWEFDRELRLRVDFWALKSPAASLERLDWFDIESIFIYEALACHHFEQIKQRVISDLRDDFAQLKESSQKRLKEEFHKAATADFERRFGVEDIDARRSEIEKQVSAALERTLEKRKDARGFMLRRFRAAALSGLAQNGSEQHLPLARDFLNSDDRDLVRSSISLIKRVGNDDDVPALLSVAGTAWGDTQRLAAEAALALTVEPVETAVELLESSNSDVVRVALRALSAAPIEEVLHPIWDLLRNDHLSIRDAATDFFIKRLQRPQLQHFPNAYSRGQYYYSVVTRVDRELYAPRWLNRSISAMLGS